MVVVVRPAMSRIETSDGGQRPFSGALGLGEWRTRNQTPTQHTRAAQQQLGTNEQLPAGNGELRVVVVVVAATAQSERGVEAGAGEVVDGWRKRKRTGNFFVVYHTYGP